MTIRPLCSEDRFAAMGLWQEVFHDTLPFATFFFTYRFAPTLSFGAFDDGRLVSMSLSRPVVTGIPTLKAVMISGVSTLPEYRRRGLMTETLTQLLQNAKEQSFDLALLSPAIPDLYVPFGFVPLTYAMRTEETAATPDELQLITETPDPIRHLVIYLAFARSHPLMLLRNQKQFQLAMQEYKADGGRTIRTIDGNGYLCFLPGENGVEVTECFAASPAHYRLLLRAAAAFSPSKTVSADLPVDCGLPGTLIRPVHGFALKSNVPLDRIAKLRKTYIVEHY